LNDDFLDLLSALLDARARFLIVGAYAVGVHARPRATKDLDVWVEASPENSRRVLRALKAFGAPIDNLDDDDFAKPGTGFITLAQKQTAEPSVLDSAGFLGCAGAIGGLYTGVLLNFERLLVG
jgi:hypothetical protein